MLLKAVDAFVPNKAQILLSGQLGEARYMASKYSTCSPEALQSFLLLNSPQSPRQRDAVGAFCRYLIDRRDNAGIGFSAYDLKAILSYQDLFKISREERAPYARVLAVYLSKLPGYDPANPNAFVSAQHSFVIGAYQNFAQRLHMVCKRTDREIQKILSRMSEEEKQELSFQNQLLKLSEKTLERVSWIAGEDPVGSLIQPCRISDAIEK